MIRKFTFILLICTLALVFGTAKSCKKPIGTGGGSAGNDWEFVQSVSSFWVNLPSARPPLRSGPNKVRIYADKEISTNLIKEITAGVRDTLFRSNWNNPKFAPVDWWQRDGKPFSVEEDYSFVLIPAQTVSQSEEHRGCGLIFVRAGGEALTAIGTNAGQQIINNIPRAPGGLYLVIAAPAENEPVESNCDVLRRRGTAAEAEHARAMGAPAIWFDVQANDFPPNPGHPYFIGPNGEGLALFENRSPDGVRADYAPFFPQRNQMLDVNLTDEELLEYERDPNKALRDVKRLAE